MMNNVLTCILKVMGGRGESLNGSGKVEKVELGVKAEEDVDGLVRDGGVLGSHVGWLWM